MWQEGPLPPGTWNWGGVVVKSQGKDPSGFYFADFCGDHVTLVPGGERVEAADVVLFNNCLHLPAMAKCRAES